MTKSSSTDPALPALSVNGFVLAGGQSRRMGRDKALMEWREETLLDRAVRILSTAAHDVRIVGRGGRGGRAGFEDRIPGQGPLGGVLTALENTAAERNVVVGVDLPLLTPRFFRFFTARTLASVRDVVACSVEGRYPLCLGLSRVMAASLASRIAAGSRSVKQFIEESEHEIVDQSELEALGFPAPMFVNVNTPEDWTALDFGVDHKHGF